MANDNPTSPASSPEATQQCTLCHGTGSIPNGTDEMACGRCAATGTLPIGGLYASISAYLTNNKEEHPGGLVATQQAAEQASEGQVAPTVFAEISRERAAQDEQWGGYIHDDSHERDAWFNWIQKQNSYAFKNSDNPYEFEHRMVKVAALAVAAIESSRRQRGALPENDKASKGQNSTGSYAKELAETRGIAGELIDYVCHQEHCSIGGTPHCICALETLLDRAEAAGISPEELRKSIQSGLE